MKFMRIARSLAFAAVLLLAGCSNIFAPRITARDSGATGTGTVRIDIEGASSSVLSSSARTLLPATMGGFARYELLFEDQAGVLSDWPVPDYTSNDPVALPEGTWTVTVSAYLSDGVGGDRLAALGEATVVIVYQKTGEPVTVTLRPVDTTGVYTGNGTFAWDIRFPASTATVTLEITGLDRTVIQTLSLKGGGPTDGTLSPEGDRSEGSIELPAGSYYAQTVLTRSGTKARRRDALFILEGMTTTADSAAGYAFADDSFSNAVYVTSAADSGSGTLRQAIDSAVDGDVIRITLPPGSVIALQSQLHSWADLTIEGNGVTLTQSDRFVLDSSLNAILLLLNDSAIIRRIHFKNALGLNTGAAIFHIAGSLTLESCIFSGNQTTLGTARGGAVFTSSADNTLTVLGCTFYNNSSGGTGGAIYTDSVYVNLGGNLFYGNTANSGGNVVYGSGTVTSLGYNVSDLPGGTFGDTSGFYFLPTDAQIANNPISRVSFRPLSTGGVLGAVDPSEMSAYPSADFYGVPIPATAAAAGAVQSPAPDTGRSLGITVRGSGTLVPSGASPGGEGLYAGGAPVTLTAAPESGWYLAWWTVNGVAQEGSSALVTLNEDTEVMARFGRLVEAADEAGLRAALNDQRDYDIITLAASATMSINSRLEPINKNIVLEGNGATLVRNFTNASLLEVAQYGSVVIRRLQFNGNSLPAANYSAFLMQSSGDVVLESCVFFNNQYSGSSMYSGGAISVYSNAVLTVMGCTFYNNASTRMGGAIANYGAVRLAGNLFYGNSGSGHNVVYTDSSAMVVSFGYNVLDYTDGTDSATGSGFGFTTTDRQDSAGLSSISFKPVQDSGALATVNVVAFNSANPGLSYPTHDFYGNTIPPFANAGAAQGGGTGYDLKISTQGPGQVTGMSFNSDGLIASGASFTLTATPATGADRVASFTVNGQPQGGDTFNVASMNTNLEVLAVFAGTYPVATQAELTQALADPLCEVISLSANITLTARITITRNMVIEGNGATITSGMTESTASQFFAVNGAGINVVMRRVHFKDGRATTYGAVFRHNNGTLVLESCIFSGNQTSSMGGAVYIAGAASVVTISGCTFYGNSAGTGSGGAVYQVAGTLNLTGNLFWQNTAASYSVVYGSPVSGGYNISDKPIGTGATESGWAFASGDDRATTQAVYPDGFKPLSTGAAYQAIGTRPGVYPAVDFYGDPIPANNAMSGAVQTATASTGYALDYASIGPGSVGVKSGSSDSAGFYKGSVTLEAVGATFHHWTVDGETQPDQNTELVVTMDKDKTVRAVFAVLVTATGNDGAGSLRQAVNDADDGGVVVLSQEQTIILTSMLTIGKNLSIEGNGAIITQNGLTTSNENPLLYIDSYMTVRISRVLFTGGRSRNNGSAIRNSPGYLTLESCIFSDNITGDGVLQDIGGGAIFSNGGSLTVLGCTFTGNSIMAVRASNGAAIGGGTVLSLTGNIFTGNTGTGNYIFPVVQNSNYTDTGGYNVSDKIGGAAGVTGRSGWVFKDDPADVMREDVEFDVNFKPSSAAGLPVIPSLPAGFPITYFDGTPRGTNSAPGAMPLQSP